MKYLLIEESLARALVQYLSQRPWAEVAQIMPPLMSLKPAPESAPKTDAELMAEHHGRYDGPVGDPNA